MNNSRPRRIIVTLFAFILSAFIFACSPKASSSGLDYITDVFVYDKSVIFDNGYHGLDIIGLRDGDVVFYSDAEDGEYSLAERVFKNVGSYTIYFKISRSGCNDLYLSATLYISYEILDGIAAYDSTVIYNGRSHEITIVGIVEDDDVKYSLDGVTFSS